ncbi:CchlQ [Streptomyces sp. NPDC048001]|uniref:CchlQ n=1 Tax=unclassified Streptomyces TaxID=2593676 RepID=UPI0037219FCB
MEWGTLVATLGGAVIAIAGTVLADRLRTRQEADQGLGARRRELYTEFITAAGTAHTELRRLAQERAPGAEEVGAEEASRTALSAAGIYEVRERLYLDASARVAGAGQAMFEKLRALRAVVGAGAPLDSAAFHEAYHPYLEAVWSYRAVVREELEGRPLTPEDFGWGSWDGRERCGRCRQGAGRAAVGG